jgi:hypothetical protein
LFSRTEITNELEIITTIVLTAHCSCIDFFLNVLDAMCLKQSSNDMIMTKGLLFAWLKLLHMQFNTHMQFEYAVQDASASCQQNFGSVKASLKHCPFG